MESESVTQATVECPVPEHERGIDVSMIQGSGGVYKRTLVESSGEQCPAKGFEVTVHYTGRLLSGEVFDSSVERNEPFKFEIGKGRVIKGWDQGVAAMRKGEKAILLCSPAYAYGASGSPPKIPANAWLSFEVELIDWEEPLHLMSKERKLERAAQRREAGNAAFKAQNYQEAITQYQASLSVLNAVYGSDSVTADLKAAVHSNVAACELKQNRFNEARKACDEALKLQPTHTKAMFRRGVALMELGEMDQAKSDLASALQLASDAKLDAEVAAIKKEQARLKLKIQAEKEKEKQLFGGWLNK